MSGTDQLISIDAEDPKYYADLLHNIPRRPANRRLPSDGRSRARPDAPGIQNVDVALSRRLQTLLDTVADISLCQRGNVSATMASLKDSTGTPETKLYIVFNHEKDKSALGCPQHLQNIFNMLRQVPYRPPATDSGSPKVIANELEDDYIGICKAIHNYSFDIFHYRVTKREHKLSEIQGYIEQDQTNFLDQQRRSTLLKFLHHVDIITKATTKALTTKQVSVTFIKTLLRMYSYWTHHNLLPKDPPADNTITLLDLADTWLAGKHGIGFQLRRWALKIMSFVISANRLFILTQSHRLHNIIRGKFSVQVLSSAPTTPYRCHLSSETIQVALNAAVAETREPPDDWDNKREWFIEGVLGKLKEPIDVVHRRPTVHAELAMIIAMVKGEIKDVLPYVGVSKLSCTMCSHYIGAFNEVWKQKIVTKGSHGKAYPGWFWPSFPDRDEELRQVFFGRLRRQLLGDFEAYAERRLLDSSVGSGGPEWEIGTSDEIEELAVGL